MKTYLSHISALYFWRQPGVNYFADLPRSRKQTLSDCCKSMEDDTGRVPLSEYFGNGRKHVIVPEPEYRVNEREYQYHVCSAKLPPRSFVELDKRTYVSSPELCFLQMAGTLSVAGLVQLGLELCGTYRLQPDAPVKTHCTQLTTPTRLANFIENCRGFHGYKKSARSLRWILAGSGSPRETQVFERLCLSNLLDGYALPFPRPNGEMRLNRRQQELAEKSTSYGDLYWEEQDVDVEYFGEEWHTGRERMNSDAKRGNALTSRKTKYYTITDDIYNDMGKFDALAREIAHALGVKINSRATDLDYRNRKLADELDEQERLTYPKGNTERDAPDGA